MGSTLRATAPVFVPQQQPPQKMRRTETPQHNDPADATTAFDQARKRAHEQAVREEEEYQAWRATELAAEGEPDDEEQARPRVALLVLPCVVHLAHLNISWLLAGLARRAAASG